MGECSIVTFLTSGSCTKLGQKSIKYQNTFVLSQLSDSVIRVVEKFVNKNIQCVNGIAHGKMRSKTTDAKGMNEICYICNNVTEQPLQNLYETRSTHSNTKISDFVHKFLENLQTHRQFNANPLTKQAAGLCDQCFTTINEYDLACVTAERIEKSLRAILLQTDALFVDEKQVNQDCDDGAASCDDEECDNRDDQPMRALAAESVAFDELENIENVEICLVEPIIEADFDEFDNLSEDEVGTDDAKQSTTVTVGKIGPNRRNRSSNADGDDDERPYECCVCQTTFSHKKDLKVL